MDLITGGNNDCETKTQDRERKNTRTVLLVVMAHIILYSVVHERQS